MSSSLIMLGSSIDDDSLFEQMIRNCWHLKEGEEVDDRQLAAIKALNETHSKSGEEIFSKYPKVAPVAASPAIEDLSSTYLSKITATEVEIATMGAKAPNALDIPKPRRS